MISDIDFIDDLFMYHECIKQRIQCDKQTVLNAWMHNVELIFSYEEDAECQDCHNRLNMVDNANLLPGIFVFGMRFLWFHLKENSFFFFSFFDSIHNFTDKNRFHLPFWLWNTFYCISHYISCDLVLFINNNHWATNDSL